MVNGRISMVNGRAGDVSPLFPLFPADSAKWLRKLWKSDNGPKSRNSVLTPTARQVHTNQCQPQVNR